MSNNILIAKACKIWPLIPEYTKKPIPDFLIGWLNKFKKRYEIKKRINYSELVLISITIKEEIQFLYYITLLFITENLFNMDETGLYWRRAISKGLTTAKLPGAKKDKSRISLVLCSNATGSEKLPP